MADSAKPVFLVDAFSDPVMVRIEGRANFQNSACLHDFFAERIRSGKTRFVLDFQECASMDSTFMGVLAGAGLQLRRLQPPGSLILSRMGPRNLELARNLGLHRIATVETGGLPAIPSATVNASAPLVCEKRNELESAKLVLQAHENLVATDEANGAKFQDVLSFLRTRVTEG